MYLKGPKLAQRVIKKLEGPKLAQRVIKKAKIILKINFDCQEISLKTRRGGLELTLTVKVVFFHQLVQKYCFLEKL